MAEISLPIDPRKLWWTFLFIVHDDSKPKVSEKENDATFWTIIKKDSQIIQSKYQF